MGVDVIPLGEAPSGRPADSFRPVGAYRAAVKGVPEAGLLVMEVTVTVAGADVMRQLAGLLGRFDGRERSASSEPALAVDLLRWWEAHQASHVPFLAVLPSGRAVGMAWLAIAARVPRPDRQERLFGDIQSVYVVPEHGRWASAPL